MFEFSEVSEESSKTSQNAKGYTRFVIVGLLFCMFGVQYGIRVGLSLSIIAMTNQTSSNPDVPYYNWDNSSIILSAFYWSYAILQFGTGHLVHRFGSKRLLLSSVFVSSSAHLLIPLAATYGSEGVIALRVIQGLFQGFMVPCLNGLLGRWLPPKELSVLNSIVYSGLTFGVIVTKVMTGYLSASSLGWPVSFYISGSAGLVWCVCWMFLASDNPGNHPYIRLEERQYIELALDQEKDHMLEIKPSIPWWEIFRSLPYWAIVVASIGESWLTTYASTQISSYLSYAVGLDIIENSLVSAASTGVTVISVVTFGSIASYTLKKGWLTVVNSRRLFQALSQYMYIIMLLTLSFIETPGIVVGLYIAGSMFSGALPSGHLVNSVDLSPRFASSMTGIANGIGQLIAILAPLLVQYMVTDSSSRSQWRNTFYLASAVGGVSVTFFVLFCSGERQWWDDVDRKKKEDEEKQNEVQNSVQ